jgi:hypothetical protein
MPLIVIALGVFAWLAVVAVVVSACICSARADRVVTGELTGATPSLPRRSSATSRPKLRLIT